MPDNYISTAELKNTLTISGESFADEDIDAAITAASRGIDHVCNRRTGFSKDGTNATRYYTPFSRGLALIDDLADTSTVKVDRDGDGTFEETWTENTDFIFEPLNAELDGRPRERIVVLPRSGKLFPCQPRALQVVGKFGWDAVPGEVVEATSILAHRLMRRAREAPFGVVTIGIDQGAAMRIARNDPDVLFLLDGLIREPVPVA